MKIIRADKKHRLLRLCYFSLCMAAVFSLSACSLGIGYNGKALIDKAASLHTGLESAHITVTDSSDAALRQEITYRFAGDILQYMYYGYDPESGTEYYEFNNGTELDTCTVPGDDSWRFCAKGSEGYYNYSRAQRHYFSDGSKLFADYPAAVSSSEITQTGDGGQRLDISYDNEKLGQYTALSGVSELTQFFEFDSGGYCVLFGNSYTLDGVHSGYNISITRRDENIPIDRKEPDFDHREEDFTQ